MKSILVRVTDEQNDMLNSMSKTFNVSKNEILRRVVSILQDDPNLMIICVTPKRMIRAQYGLSKIEDSRNMTAERWQIGLNARNDRLTMCESKEY